MSLFAVKSKETFFERFDMRKRMLVLISCFSAFVLLSSIGAQESDMTNERLSNMAEELVKIRSDVESLYTKVDFRKVEIQEELKNLISKQRELERKDEMYEKSIADQTKKVDELNQSIETKVAVQKKYFDVTEKILLNAQDYLKTSIPFKKTERNGEVKNLVEELKNKEVTPDKVLSKLWSMQEDEIRLTSDIGVYSQNVDIDGSNKLVKLARLGMVLIYFKTIDDQIYGYATKSGEEWKYEAVSDKKQVENIQYLFDCLEKKLQTGFFELPNPFNK